MSVYKPVHKGKETLYYHYDFQYRGQRFHGSTGCTNERDAEKAERAKKDEARRLAKAQESASSIVTLQINHVAERYWQEKGQHHAGAANTDRDLARLVDYFGPTKLLSEITDNDVTKLVAWRRAQRATPRTLPEGKKREDYPFITPSTVNRTTTEVLKKLFTHAKTAWRVRFEHEPHWKAHILCEPQERVRELVGDEAKRLEEETRDDYLPFFRFAHRSGLREAECVDLRWSEVNWDSGQIVRLGKGGKRVTVPITPDLREILEAQLGNHDEFVFTYVAARTVRARKAGESYVRTGRGRTGSFVAERDQDARVGGKRYPMTVSGVKTAWRRLRAKAGVKDFRFHDFRHDFATKLLRQSKNLKLVSRALNHADLKTTMRYAHVLDEDIAEAVAALHETMRPTSAPEEGLPTQDRDSGSRKKSRNAA